MKRMTIFKTIRATIAVLLYGSAIFAMASDPSPAQGSAASAPKASSGHGHGGMPHWTYEGPNGPDNWGKLHPSWSLCSKGQTQSPIDVRDGLKLDLPEIKFDYRPSNFSIVNNGHTIQVSYQAGGSLTFMGKQYQLVQFHFHRPSEERINGKQFEMVAHLVHRDSNGNLAVVGVMLTPGAEHPFIQALWNHLPLMTDDPVAPPDVQVDLNTLLPAQRQYFNFMGSLTTPPCSEGVLWFVMKQPVEVSPEQIAIFSRMYRNNARPIQPTNDRRIKESRSALR